MDILIGIFIIFTFTVAPLKVGANILKIEKNNLSSCFVGVFLYIIAVQLIKVMIGDGLFPDSMALIVTGGFFSLLFKTNIVTGFILAVLTMGIQTILSLIAIGLGFTFFS